MMKWIPRNGEIVLNAVFVPVFAIVMPVVLEFTVIDAAVANTVKEPPPAN